MLKCCIDQHLDCGKTMKSGSFFNLIQPKPISHLLSVLLWVTVAALWWGRKPRAAGDATCASVWARTLLRVLGK